MKKFAQWAVMAFGTVVAIALASHTILTWLTNAGREASVGRLHTRLARDVPASESALPNTTPASALPENKKAPDAALIASWKRLFETWASRMEDDAFKERWETFYYIPLHVRWGDTEYNALSDEERESLTAFLEENRDILEGIHALTKPDMPPCDFGSYKDTNYHWQFDALLCANILLNAARGNHAEVPLDLAALLKMCDADAYIDYPFLMGRAMENCLDDALRSGVVPDATWQLLLDQLEESRAHSIFVQDWTRSAGVWLEWYENLPASGSDTTNPPVIGQILGWGYSYAGTPLLNYNMDRYSDVMDQLLEVAPLPYFEAKPELARIREEYDIPVPWELKLWELEPGIWNIATLIHERFSGRAYVEAHIDMARFAILLERERRRSGAYPASLVAVAGGFGGQVPVNPGTGKPFRYQLEEEGYRLWYTGTYEDDNGVTHDAQSTWPGQWEDLGPSP